MADRSVPTLRFPCCYRPAANFDVKALNGPEQRISAMASEIFGTAAIFGY